MKKIIFLFVVYITSSFCISAKDTYSWNYARFRADSGKVYLEVYYSFIDTSLTLKELNDKKLYSEFFQSIELKKIGAEKADILYRWILSDTLVTPPKEPKLLTGQKVFKVDPGQYNLTVSYQDFNDTNQKYSKTELININSFSDNIISQSDLQFASSIKNATLGEEKNIFYKNNFIVLPNPSNVIASNEPIYYAYSEIYNAKKYAVDGLMIDYILLNSNNENIATINRSIQPKADGFVNIIEFPLYDLPTGTYFFKQVLKYPMLNPTDSSVAIQKIFVVNPSSPPIAEKLLSEDELFQRSEFITMNEERLKEEFEKSSIILTKQEIDTYKELTDKVAKQKTLFAYWLIRDINPNTSVNEAKEDYDRRADYANLHFESSTRKYGWQTERGRVLLKYGNPSNIDRKPGVGDNRPYDIWYYDTQQGGIHFVFVDSHENGNYVLVHSNAKEEFADENWYNKYVVKNNVNKNDEQLYKDRKQSLPTTIGR